MGAEAGPGHAGLPGEDARKDPGADPGGADGGRREGEGDLEDGGGGLRGEEDAAPAR